MMVRAGSGWQTVLADLSLILFMVTAAALSQAPDKAGPPVSETPRQPSPRAEPLAVWREGAGAPPLAQWLATQPADPRVQLTVLAPYAPGRAPQAMAAAARMADAAERAGVSPRVVVEPGVGEPSVTLAYDAPAATLARGLQDTGATQPKEPAR